MSVKSGSDESGSHRKEKGSGRGTEGDDDMGRSIRNSNAHVEQKKEYKHMSPRCVKAALEVLGYFVYSVMYTKLTSTMHASRHRLRNLQQRPESAHSQLPKEPQSLPPFVKCAHLLSSASIR